MQIDSVTSAVGMYSGQILRQIYAADWPRSSPCWTGQLLRCNGAASFAVGQKLWVAVGNEAGGGNRRAKIGWQIALELATS